MPLSFVKKISGNL